jgi:hypothetical protein
MSNYCPLSIDLNTKCNLTPNECTLCNRPASKGNVWIENNICRLDEIDYDVVCRVLSHVPRARKDLLEITNDPTLIALANTVGLVIPDQEENEIHRKRLTRNTLPYYTIFKGNVGGNII